jgi:archaellum component FlaF (FlaF/FlaG flagellin family)
MKKNLWISISAAVILIAAVICFVYIYNNHKSVVSHVQNTIAKVAPKPITTTIPQIAGTGAKDSSDASINQDLSNIDAQMSGLNADASNMNSSVNNQ